MGRLFMIIQSNIEPQLRELGGYDPYKSSFDDDPVNELKAGDILGITRPAGYEHYAVYIGDKKVIHFAAAGTDFGEATVHQAPISAFLDGQTEFFLLDFKAVGRRPTKKTQGSVSASTPLIEVGAKVLKDTISDALSQKDDPDITHIYSPEETVARAKSVIGANEHNFAEKYDLVLNNCEHFAIWCKTGAHKSYQVENVLKLVTPDVMFTVQGL